LGNRWYLIRNLYGAPFFKPDLHINAIVAHFFGRDKLDEMTVSVRQLWPQVCSDKRFLPVHIGIVDYMLWWYRQKTGEPAEKETEGGKAGGAMLSRPFGDPSLFRKAVMGPRKHTDKQEPR
jgi:hypothetical protein